MYIMNTCTCTRFQKVLLISSLTEKVTTALVTETIIVFFGMDCQTLELQSLSPRKKTFELKH